MLLVCRQAVQTAKPFEMLHDVAFHLGLYCLQKCPFMSLHIKVCMCERVRLLLGVKRHFIER